MMVLFCIVNLGRGAEITFREVGENIYCIDLLVNNGKIYFL